MESTGSYCPWKLEIIKCTKGEEKFGYPVCRPDVRDDLEKLTKHANLQGWATCKVDVRLEGPHTDILSNDESCQAVATRFQGAGALLGGSVLTSVTAFSSDQIEALHYGFDHQGPLSSFDYASVRRGYQVYREVCASCHSLDRICFRNLVGVTHTEEELKAMAADIDVVDGPNDEGEMFERPGKLSDPLPRPYPNDEAAAAANNGAVPPDLSLMVKARHGGADYLFALLTGYVDPPEGMELMDGLHYNPYFGGGAIAMERQLQDGQIEYEDGTPCTTSQMAKDVSVFLSWAAEPEHDIRKKQGMQATIALLVLSALTGYYKRLKWAPLKTRKITYTK